MQEERTLVDLAARARKELKRNLTRILHVISEASVKVDLKEEKSLLNLNTACRSRPCYVVLYPYATEDCQVRTVSEDESTVPGHEVEEMHGPSPLDSAPANKAKKIN